MTKTKRLVMVIVAALTAAIALVGVLIASPWSTNAVEQNYNVTMVSGASLKMTKTSPALRFFAEIDGIDDTCDYGMIIMPADYLNTYSFANDYHAVLETENAEHKDVTCYPYSETDGSNTKYYIRAALTDIAFDDYYTDYVAIGYVKDFGGNYHYATVSNTDARSVMNVALGACALDRVWTAEEQQALDYFYAVENGEKTTYLSDALIADTLDTAVWSVSGESFSMDNANYATINSTAEQMFKTSASYSDIQSIQFDFNIESASAWWGFSTGEIYATPIGVQNMNISNITATLNGGSAESINTCYYSAIQGMPKSIFGSWITLKYEITGDTTAKLYLAKQGENLVYTCDLVCANSAKMLKSGKLGFGCAGDTTFHIDNVIIETAGGTVTETFDKESNIFDSDSITRNTNGLVFGKTTTEDAHFNFASVTTGDHWYDATKNTGYKFYNHLTTVNSYQGITEFGFDVKINGSGDSFLYVTLGGSAYYPPVVFGRTRAAVSAATEVNGNNSINQSFADWVSVRYIIDTNTEDEIDLRVVFGARGSETTKTMEVKLNSTKSFDLTAAGYLSFFAIDNKLDVAIDNVYITTASGTDREDFSKVTSSTDETYYRALVFDKMMIDVHTPKIGYFNQVVTAFNAETELSADYIEAKTAATVDANIKDGKVISTIELDYVATSGGAFGVGFSKTEFLSVSYVTDGAYTIKLNKNGVYGETIVSLTELSGKLLISLYKDGSIAVSVNGGEEVTLGTVSTANLKVTVLNFNALGSVNVTNVTASNVSTVTA